MDTEIKTKIEYIKSLIGDLESIPLPWTEIEIATFRSEWLDGVGVMNKLALQGLTNAPEYNELADSFRQNQEKIDELRLAYPVID